MLRNEPSKKTCNEQNRPENEIVADRLSSRRASHRRNPLFPQTLQRLWASTVGERMAASPLASRRVDVCRRLGEVARRTQEVQMTYFAAATDVSEMVVPSAVPVTLACSQASLLSVSSVA